MAKNKSQTHDMTFVKELVQKLGGISSSQLAMPYYMYFDETNNVKSVTANKNAEIQRTLNIDHVQEHFLLGGIAMKEFEEPLTLNDFKKAINISLKSPMQEIKSGSIYKGDFLHVIRSRKLTPVLELIRNKHWFIHYSDVNILYYCIVDIVDSLLYNSNYQNLWWSPEVFYWLKDEFYRIFVSDLEKNLERLLQFDYPDVKKKDLHDFREFIAEMIIKYHTKGGGFNKYTTLLVQVLIDSENHQRDLVFVQDEEKGILIDDFVHFYTTRISVLASSHLTLDNEGDIIAYLQKTPLFMDEKLLANHQFVDSKSNTFIQLSDIVVGLLARYFAFVDKKWDDIKKDLDQLTDTALQNLHLLNEILIYSEQENRLFCDQVERIGVIRNFWQVVNDYR